MKLDSYLDDIIIAVSLGYGDGKWPTVGVLAFPYD